MAAETCRAEVLISLLPTVIAIRISAVVLMAENALERREVSRIDVAVGAIIPLSLVLAGVNREILRVMIPTGRCPRGCRMASLARGRESSRGMTWRGCVVVAPMTREAR